MTDTTINQTDDTFTYRELTFRRTADGGAETDFGGFKLRYWPVEDPGNGDAWRYEGFLTGSREKGLMVFSHPTELGCRIGIRKAAIEIGAIAIPEDNSHLDETDAAYLAAAIEARQSRARMLVGDFVTMPDGAIKRVAYDWGDAFQLTRGGSFYLTKMGGASMSGGLEPSIPAGAFERTDATMLGRFWFFHHDRSGPGRGIDVVARCRVWKCDENRNG